MHKAACKLGALPATWALVQRTLPRRFPAPSASGRRPLSADSGEALFNRGVATVHAAPGRKDGLLPA